MSSRAELGFGSSTFGREIDAPQAHRLLDLAWQRGIRHFDSAATYSAGKSEAILGGWLEAHPELRAELTVATKMYPPFTAENVEAALAASLARLRVDYVDVFYLHKWDPAADSVACWRALSHLVRSGRVRQIGACNFTAAQLEACLEHQTREDLVRFTWLQNNHNIAVREAAAKEREVCARNGVKLVTYSPLGAGFLTGKHRESVAPGSRFDVSPGHRDIYFTPDCWDRLAQLERTAKRVGIDQTLLALSWAIHQPGTDVVLIGARRAEQLDQAFAACGLGLPPEFLGGAESWT
jgi:aryl-alcohol dehydrogenase-like predicted oxidoreductase